jgi:hypothetical protein
VKSTVIGASVACAAFGIVQPKWADRAAHVLVLVVLGLIVVSWIAARITATDVELTGAFLSTDPPPPPTIATPDVIELARSIAQARGSVPPEVAGRLRTAAAGLLADHHRLNAARVDHAALIRSTVGPLTWQLLQATDDTHIAVRDLSTLLDELETL